MIAYGRSFKPPRAGEPTCFVFREATDGEEILALLCIRYIAYRSNGLGRIVKANPYRIDVDCYDLRARHFGLFQVDRNRQLPIGYVRTVEDRLSTESKALGRALVRFPELRAVAARTCAQPFPLMTYLPDTEAIRVLCARLKDAGERLVEVSRFALLTGHGSLRLARHMVEAITAIVFFDWGVEHAVWCCDSSHKAFYALYGFRPLEGTTEGDFLGLGVRSFCVYASVAEVPGRLRGRLIAKARIHSRLGCIPYEAKSGRVDYGAQPEDVRRTQPAFASL